MAERRFSVDHSTVHRWAVKLLPSGIGQVPIDESSEGHGTRVKRRGRGGDDRDAKPRRNEIDDTIG